MVRFRQLAILTRLAFLEVVRQPICLLLTASCVALTICLPLVLLHNFGEGNEVVRDGGLALHFVLGLFIAGYASCSSLAGEIQSGTAASVLSKPVSRETFFLSKFFGVVGVILLFSLCSILATMIAERATERFVFSEEAHGWVNDHYLAGLALAAPVVACAVASLLNYRFKLAFVPHALKWLVICLVLVFMVSGLRTIEGKWGGFGFLFQWRIIPAGILVTLALLVLSSVALSLSTRFATVTTLTVSVIVFLGGLMSDYVLGRQADHSAICAFFYGVIPNWQHFWVADVLRRGNGISWQYVVQVLCYGVLYTVGFLCLGALSFGRSEVK